MIRCAATQWLDPAPKIRGRGGAGPTAAQRVYRAPCIGCRGWVCQATAPRVHPAPCRAPQTHEETPELLQEIRLTGRCLRRGAWRRGEGLLSEW